MNHSAPAGRNAGTWALFVGMVALAPVRAQTGYYNLDAGRPTRVEDAIVVRALGGMSRSIGLRKMGGTIPQYPY